MKLKSFKRIIKITSAVIAAAGVAELALAKYEESHGDFSREFSDVQEELAAVIEKVKGEKQNGKQTE